jgi:uncharacterized membrane protein
MDKLVANVTLLLAALGALLTLLIAFGVQISPDQHTAIVGFASAALAVLGVWFHPDIPVGKTG